MAAADLLPAGVEVFERGWLSSNNVLLRGPSGCSLVDSGYGSHAELTTALVRTALDDEPLVDLVNTHLHSDHCGGNAALQAAYPGVRTWVPPGVATAVRAWDEDVLTYAATGQVCPRFSLTDVLPVGGTVQLGQLPWQVHAAPGHDPHSVILYEPASRTLISADALWRDGFGIVFPELEGDHAFDEVAATLTLIEELDPAVVIPGHGPVFDDVGPAIERARSRLAAYVANPAKHAGHAAKVLMKFKLLDARAMSLAELTEWASGTPYCRMVHRRWAAGVEFQQWISQLVSDLVKVGAAQNDASMISNS